MRVIKSDSGFLIYQKIFKQVQANSSPLVIWQFRPESGERKVTEGRLLSFEVGSINLQLPPNHSFSNQLPTYFYSKDCQFIFKSSIQQMKDRHFSISIPPEIQVLEEPDVQIIKGNCGVDLSTIWSARSSLPRDGSKDVLMVKSMKSRTSRDQKFLNDEFNLSIDEEEKMFADKREAPRARPKKDKMVKVKNTDNDEVQFCKLFDLSQGGLAFVSLLPDLFPKGCTIHVLGFEEFDLDDPMVATVMSHRPIDETQTEFKIGCKFDQGQD